MPGNLQVDIKIMHDPKELLCQSTLRSKSRYGVVFRIKGLRLMIQGSEMAGFQTARELHKP